MPKDLRSLPKLRDSISFLYIDRAVIEQDAMAVVAIRENSRIPIPIGSMTVLFLGPGTTITHAAVKTIAESGCAVVWSGMGASRFYAFGQGETRSAEGLLKQARLFADEKLHMQVVYRMYARRFPNMKTEGMTLQQVRGLEGIRVREAYKAAAAASGVPWKKRDYKTEDWDASDPVNKALSYANVILYAVCRAAIMTMGYSPGLGFIHTGKQLAFVYDIADLYKATTTIPAAFKAVACGAKDWEQQVRIECRRYFTSRKLLSRLPEDIAYVLGDDMIPENDDHPEPGDLWDGAGSTLKGGKNYAGGDQP